MVLKNLKSYFNSFTTYPVGKWLIFERFVRFLLELFGYSMQKHYLCKVR